MRLIIRELEMGLKKSENFAFVPYLFYIFLRLKEVQNMKKTRYIFVTGGVVSSLGKGIVSASIGKLLQARGYSVTIQKFDPHAQSL